jgi:Ni2+-binding GTPase involved in maturation of urease and hydrogenase
MPLIVVGGSGRGVGKTSLVCGLIAELAEYRWTAIKISDHSHGDGEPIREERTPAHSSDTQRYLDAGAHRALLVEAPDETIAETVRALWEQVDASTPLIFESNRVVDYCRADVCLAVTGGEEAAYKPSFARFAERADAVVVRSTADSAQRHARPVYFLAETERISPELLAWVRGRLAGKT